MLFNLLNVTGFITYENKPWRKVISTPRAFKRANTLVRHFSVYANGPRVLFIMKEKKIYKQIIVFMGFMNVPWGGGGRGLCVWGARLPCLQVEMYKWRWYIRRPAVLETPDGCSLYITIDKIHSVFPFWIHLNKFYLFSFPNFQTSVLSYPRPSFFSCCLRHAGILYSLLTVQLRLEIRKAAGVLFVVIRNCENWFIKFIIAKLLKSHSGCDCWKHRNIWEERNRTINRSGMRFSSL